MDDLVARSVDRYISEQNPERELDGYWHPSSVSSPCIRRAILEKRQRPFSSPPDDETKRIFMLGKVIHKLVQDAVSKDPHVTFVAPEVELFDDDLAGSADILIYRSNLACYELIEIKSIKQAGLSFGVPKAEHVIQAGLYASVLRDKGGRLSDGTIIPPLGRGLAYIRFVYVVKETMEIVEKVVDASPAIADGEERLRAVMRYDDMDELPMVTGSGNWFKNYCPYRGSGVCCAD